MAYHQQIGAPLVTGQAVASLAFSHNGAILASGDGGGTVQLWQASVAAWVQRACQVANRNLTLQEWQEYLGSASYHATCPGLAQP